MAVTISEIGQLINEAGPSNNPRELEFFSNAIAHSVDSGTTVLSWELTGDVPVGLSINSSGLISGTIDSTPNQPSAVPKKPHNYVEVDCRSFPDANGAYVNDTYDFVFTTTVHWDDTFITSSTSVSHTITLIIDWTAAGAVMFQELLDGALGRDPNHCAFSGPSSQAQCELIGGTWNSATSVCSVATPQNQIDCEAVGGTWENAKCNMTIIQTQAECLAVGGTWKKNTLVVNGVEYDNYAAYKVAYDAYVATL